LGRCAQFICFTGTKVQILAQKYKCFTGTKVQILTQRARATDSSSDEGAGGVEVDDGNGGKIFKVAGKLGWEAIEPVNLWGKAIQLVQRVPEPASREQREQRERERVRVGARARARKRAREQVRQVEQVEESAVAGGQRGGLGDGKACERHAGEKRGKMSRKAVGVGDGREGRTEMPGEHACGGGGVCEGVEGVGAEEVGSEEDNVVLVHNLLFNYEGTQFTSFTSTKVHMLTPEELQSRCASCWRRAAS
jgi:hypothetical protein